MKILDKVVIVLIGLLGCGKLMFLWCFNWMNDIIDGIEVNGEILMDG